MTSLSSRYFGIPTTSPPRGPVRLAQFAEPAGTNVVSVGPHAGEAVDDGAAVLRPLLTELRRHGIADQPRDGRSAPPALGCEEPGGLLVEIELCTPHATMYDIHRPPLQGRRRSGSGEAGSGPGVRALSRLLHERSARRAPARDRGQTAGAGVFGWASKRSGRSYFAVDGGLPLVRAGASAHHPSENPSRTRTATRPWAASSSEDVQPALPPLTVIESDLTRTVAIGPAGLVLFQRQPSRVRSPMRVHPLAGRSTTTTSFVRPAEL